MSILTFLGIAAIAIFCKFIWDTYLTNNTERQYQENKKRNPDEVARMTNNVARKEYLNFDYSPKSVPAHRAMSIVALAEKYDCSPDDVKERFQIDYLESVRLTCSNNHEAIALLAKAIEELRNSKSGEATMAVIDPDDTQAAVLEEWLLEILAAISESRLNLGAKFNKEIPVDSDSAVIVHEIQRPGNRYKVTFQQVVNGKKRFVSEWLSEEVVLGLRDGKGLHIGQEVSGWCIKRLTSGRPFFDGQQPDSITGLYSRMVMKELGLGEPNDDSFVSGSNKSEWEYSLQHALGKANWGGS